MESQDAQLIESIAAACQQVSLLQSLQPNLTGQAIESIAQFQWHNKCGEVKLPLPSPVSTASLSKLESQLGKVCDKEQVVDDRLTIERPLPLPSVCSDRYGGRSFARRHGAVCSFAARGTADAGTTHQTRVDRSCQHRLGSAVITRVDFLGT